VTYGQIVAKDWKKQYCKRGKWLAYADWPIQPEAYYRIIRELKSIEAIQALLNSSWVRHLKRKPAERAKRRGKR
jgi:hypothetical protein